MPRTARWPDPTTIRTGASATTCRRHRPLDFWQRGDRQTVLRPAVTTQTAEAARAADELVRNLREEVIGVWKLEFELRWHTELIRKGSVSNLMQSQARLQGMVEARGERNLVRTLLTGVILGPEATFAGLQEVAAASSPAVAADLLELREELASLVQRLAGTASACGEALVSRLGTGGGTRVLSDAVLAPTGAVLSGLTPHRLLEFIGDPDHRATAPDVEDGGPVTPRPSMN